MLNSDFSTLNVLIVDDEPSMTRLLKMMLNDLDVGVILTAKDGCDALDMLGRLRDPVDVIICDWNMPRMSGLELLKRIREVDSQVPFIMLTGRADLDSVVAARDSLVSAYLLKPFSPQVLESRLAKVTKRALEAA